MEAPREPFPWLRGLAGAIVGGVLGCLVFVGLYRFGLYGFALPGAGLGLGAAMAARHSGRWFRILCGVAGALVALLAEWQVAPFVADGSLGYFVAHLHQLRGIGLAGIALSGLAAYWLSEGQYATAAPPPPREQG